MSYPASEPLETLTPDAPALEILQPDPEPQARSGAERNGAAKRGNLHGGAATEAALSSSRRVLTNARGNKGECMEQEQKQCTVCNEVKPVSDFNRKRRNSWDSRCKQCKSEYSKSRYNDDKRRKLVNKKRLLKEQGLCLSCGKAPVARDRSKVRCAQCTEYSRLANAKHRRKARQTLFEMYGGPTCACCGEMHERFLTFDHVNDDGAEHRLYIGQRSNGRGFSDTVSLHRALKKAGYPPIIQILCFNCNMGKHLNGGVCPHQEAEADECD